jgi:hypothetical protein
MSSIMIDVLEVSLRLAGYQPERRTNGAQLNPMATLNYLKSRDQDVECDRIELRHVHKQRFAFSVIWMYLDLDRTFEPGFFFSMSFSEFCSLRLYVDSCLSDILSMIGQKIPSVPVVEEQVVEPEEDTIEEYIEDMDSAANVHVLSQDYDDYESNGRAFVRRLPVIVQIVGQIPPEEVIYAPCDGIGVVSLACRQMCRKYVSSEQFGLGARAVRLGLITSDLSYEDAIADIPDGAVVVLSNLSRYVNLEIAIQRFRCVVLDELLTYPGFSKLHEVPYSGGRLRCHIALPITNVMCGPIIPLTFDRFISRDIEYTTDDSKLLYQLPKFGYRIRPCAGSQLAREIGAGNGQYIGRLARHVVPVDTFMVDYRKTASGVNGRRGQRRLIGSDWHKYSNVEYIAPFDYGFIKVRDANYKSRHILFDHKIPDSESFELKVRFNPTRLKYAQKDGALVRIVVSNVRFRNGMYNAVVRRYFEHFNNVEMNV